MIIKNISVLVVTVLIAASLPHTSNAYFTQTQTESTLTPITALYTITYSFGLPNQDLYMPLTSERNGMHGESESTLGYTIRNGNEDVVTEGNTASFIYSTAEIKNGMYFIPKGSVASFTLVTLFRTQEGTPTENYSMLVENLPFLVDIEASTLQVRDLNPSELQYYTTNAVQLNSNDPAHIQVTNITTDPATIIITPNGK